MSTPEELQQVLNEIGEDARQSLGAEMAEEVTDFNKLIKQTHENEIGEMTISNIISLMSEQEPMVGMLKVTASTFVTGMMAYRLYLNDVAPEAVALVDEKIRNSMEEPTND
jgi:hypothetical protein